MHANIIAGIDRQLKEIAKQIERLEKRIANKQKPKRKIGAMPALMS